MIFHPSRRHHRPLRHPEVDAGSEGRMISAFLFLYLNTKSCLLRSSAYLLLIAICISFCGCSNKSKKASSGYTDLQWGEYLQYYNKTDSAFLMFSKATNSSTDSMDKGKAYMYMGVMQRQVGDLYGAQESLAAALKTLDVKNKEHRDLIATVYNTLGNTSLDLKKYNEAIGFYDAALSITKEKNYILEILNGKATALQKKKETIPMQLLYMIRYSIYNLLTEYLLHEQYLTVLKRSGLKIQIIQFWANTG